MNWSDTLTDFGKHLLRYLGEDPWYLPKDRNPITDALKNQPYLLHNLEQEPWFDRRTCRIKLSRAAVSCQMAVYDHIGGPDGEFKPKALRRSWYAWYKVDFAQPLSKQLGEDGFDGTNWAGRMSSTYAEFVDDGVTYHDLWVDDASRMIRSFYERLYQDCHIIFAVEKDSLFDDMQAPASAMGAASLVSGKGKMSKAGTEKVLREHFGWRPDHDPFTLDDPLYIIHLSDHDYDGEQVIGPTFADQASRYTPYIHEARIGILPESVDKREWEEKWYDVKVSNSGYVEWAEDQGLFEFECLNCGHRWLDVGTFNPCPDCDQHAVLFVKHERKSRESTPHGFEVEALPTRSYYSMAVDALLRLLPFCKIVRKLREECTANAYDAAYKVAQEIYEKNEDYQRLLEEFDRLEAIKEEFERRATDQLHDIAAPHEDAFEHLEDDPTPDDYREHVHNANTWTKVWRPFSRALRTEALAEWLKENAENVISELSNERIDW